MLNGKVRKIIRGGAWKENEISWVPEDGLIWDSTNGATYKRTTTTLMKSIIYTSARSKKIKFDGTMYYLGPVPAMLQGISRIMRQKYENGEIK